jgi:hypothetical protein
MDTWNDWNDWNDWNHQQDDVGDIGDGDATGAMPDPSWPDPWDDPHDIEYWVWNGERLVPASSSERVVLQEIERTQSARRRLAQWEHEQRVAARSVPIIVGICRIIVAVRSIWRHGARPTTPPLEAHHTAISAHQQDGER